MIIEFNIPRPLTLLVGVFAVAGWLLWWNGVGTPGPTTGQLLQQSSSNSSEAVGGYDPAATLKAVEAEEKAYFARKMHDTLEKQEELLRFQLRLVEEEQKVLGTSVTEAQEQEFIEARTNLIKLLQDKEEAETQIRAALNQLWDARQEGAKVSIQTSGQAAQLIWPVVPTYGVSATFRDPEYTKQFGFKHDGLDMPVLQGSDVFAAADGVVEKAADNGLGYSYIIVRHSGIATLYGHMSAINVAEGQVVAQGEVIGLSGGRPGSKGAGKHTTGPHLHFEVIKDGQRIDPETVLPMEDLL